MGFLDFIFDSVLDSVETKVNNKLDEGFNKLDNIDRSIGTFCDLTGIDKEPFEDLAGDLGECACDILDAVEEAGDEVVDFLSSLFD